MLNERVRIEVAYEERAERAGESFRFPAGVASIDDAVLVLDSGNARVLRFERGGGLTGTLGGAGQGPGELSVGLKQLTVVADRLLVTSGRSFLKVCYLRW